MVNITDGPNAPVVGLSNAEKLQFSLRNLAQLLRSAKWNKNNYPRRPIGALFGLCIHPFKADIEFRDLPLLFPEIEVVFQDVLKLYHDAFWRPSQFENVVNAMNYLSALLIAMQAVPLQPKEEDENVQVNEFIPGGSGADCGPKDWPEHFEGFGDTLESDPEPGEPEDGISAAQ